MINGGRCKTLALALPLAALIFSGCSDDNAAALPDFSQKSFTGNSLTVTYQGEEMAGKTASVTLDPSAMRGEIRFYQEMDLSLLSVPGLTGKLPGPGVMPGSAELVLPVTLSPADGVYSFSGTSATEDVDFTYSGVIAADRLNVSFTDCKLKNQALAGNVFSPAPLEKNGLNYTSMPFHLEWEIDPALGIDIPLSDALKALALAPLIPVYNNTAYSSVSQLLCSVLRTVALTSWGNVPVMYVSTTGGAAHIATTCGNMMQYVPQSQGLRLFINPMSVFGELLVATSDNKNDVKFDFEEMFGRPRSEAVTDVSDPADAGLSEEMKQALKQALIKSLLAAVAPQLSGGVPLTATPTTRGIDIYFDTATSVTFLSQVLKGVIENPELMAAIKKQLAGITIPGVSEEQINSVLDNLTLFLQHTTRLEVGLSLVKYKG